MCVFDETEGILLRLKIGKVAGKINIFQFDKMMIMHAHLIYSYHILQVSLNDSYLIRHNYKIPYNFLFHNLHSSFIKKKIVILSFKC